MSFERAATFIYPVLRFVYGFLFLCHGLQKFGLLGGHMVPLFSRFGAAAVIEIVCGPLIAVGAFTRIVAFVASGETAFAYFLQHAPHGYLPILNNGEAAVMFSFAFLYIAARGAGRFGFDKS